MKIVVVGAGALGSAIGGTLAMNGLDVTLVSSNRSHAEAINQQGLTLVMSQDTRTVAVRAVPDCASVAPMQADVVIILVKSSATREAVMSAKEIVGPQTCVFSLQNGLGHEDVIAQAIGARHVLGGKTYAGGVMLAPGKVQASVAGKRTIIGELTGGSSPRTETIAQAFSAAGVPTEVSTNMRGTIWDKLLINISTGALSAITRMTYGELYARPDIRDCALAAVEEAMAVARAEGVVLSIDAARTAWDMASAGLPDNFRTSMLQSVDKGRRTEIDYINGAVARRGTALGIATPVNSLLTACVHGIEISNGFGSPATSLERDIIYG